MHRGAVFHEIGCEADASEFRLLLDLFEETYPTALSRIEAAIAETALRLYPLPFPLPQAP